MHQKWCIGEEKKNSKNNHLDKPFRAEIFSLNLIKITAVVHTVY